MKAVFRNSLIAGIVILSLNSCGSHHLSDATDSTANQDSTNAVKTLIDSASYQRGVEHSVNEKLLKQYKTKKKN